MMPWQAPDMWKGGECWIIGGGASMPHQFCIPESLVRKVRNGDASPSEYSPYLSALHMKHVIGVNDAFLIGNWIDVVFFGDISTYTQHKFRLAKWAGIRITCASELRDMTEKTGIKFMARDPKKRTGITRTPRCVSWNLNSGGASISLAYHFGVKRIYLLGFDMCSIAGNTHWHDRGGESREPPFHRHMEGFDDIAADAKELGLEIINCSPESQLNQFPKMTVAGALVRSNNAN